MKVQCKTNKNMEIITAEKSKYRNRRKKEKAEIQNYLKKLQELVPFMSENKTLSKVEVIENAIDYIHDLTKALGLPECEVNFEVNKSN